MRLLLSFALALLVSLALFALMVLLVMPPSGPGEELRELARVNFVRSLSDSDSQRRERQQREPPPEQPALVQPLTPQLQPQPPQPPMSQVELNIRIPTIEVGLALSQAPSLQGLTAAQTAPVTAPAPADSGPSLSEEVTPLVDIPPDYPQRALAAGIEGQVTLAFTITPEGRVANLRVVHAEPPGVFEREARRAALRWRFAPRRENGQAVSREATKTLYFRLQGGRR